MVSKETLVKTIVVLENECKEQSKKVESLLIESRKFCIGNFFVERIDRRLFSKEGCRINLKNNDVDFSFDVMNDGTVSNIGWSSHSYSQISSIEETNTVINESLAYINCIQEYLLLLSSEELIEFTNLVDKFYQEILLPEMDRLYDIRSQINELEKEIKEQDNQVVIKESINFFEMNKLYAMYKVWNWSKSKYGVADFEISTNKKGELRIRINEERNRRPITEKDLVSLYRHYIKPCFAFTFTNTGEHYYRSDSNTRNVIDGKIDYATKQDWIEITEEEYRSDRK